MFDLYSYEQVQAANAEMRKRSLDRYERLNRKSPETDPVRGGSDGDVLEIVFASGCPENDQLSA